MKSTKKEKDKPKSFKNETEELKRFENETEELKSCKNETIDFMKSCQNFVRGFLQIFFSYQKNLKYDFFFRPITRGHKCKK